MSNAVLMEWRQCPSFRDYEVSDCGEVRRASHASNQPGRRLRGYIDADGYLQYSIRTDDGVKTHALAHRLVAEAFIGPAPSIEHQVAHNDGSRIHNVPSNLRWALYAENEADRELHGTRPAGMRNPKARITEDDVRYIRRRYREIKLERGRVAELDEQFGIGRSQIIRIARGQAWGHVR